MVCVLTFQGGGHDTTHVMTSTLNQGGVCHDLHPERNNHEQVVCVMAVVALVTEVRFRVQGSGLRKVWGAGFRFEVLGTATPQTLRVVRD